MVVLCFRFEKNSTIPLKKRYFFIWLLYNSKNLCKFAFGIMTSSEAVHLKPLRPTHFIPFHICIREGTKSVSFWLHPHKFFGKVELELKSQSG